MSDHVKVTIYALPDELLLAARAAKAGIKHENWSPDSVLGLAYGEGANSQSFAVKRNKAGFTVWSQQVASDPPTNVTGDQPGHAARVDVTPLGGTQNG